MAELKPSNIVEKEKSEQLKKSGPSGATTKHEERESKFDEEGGDQPQASSQRESDEALVAAEAAGLLPLGGHRAVRRERYAVLVVVVDGQRAQRALRGRYQAFSAIPYGPYIVIATLLMLLWGAQIWDMLY